MPTGLSLQSRVKGVLRKLNATARVVQLRDTVISGGDELLGLNTTVTVTDTPVDPPPVVEAVPDEIIATSGGLFQQGDYRILLAGDIPESTLRNRQILYGSDVLNIKQIKPVAFGGVVVAWEVIAGITTPGDAS